jgi:hypothetical protein
MPVLAYHNRCRWGWEVSMSILRNIVSIGWTRKIIFSPHLVESKWENTYAFWTWLGATQSQFRFKECRFNSIYLTSTSGGVDWQACPVQWTCMSVIYNIFCSFTDRVLGSRAIKTPSATNSPRSREFNGWMSLYWHFACYVNFIQQRNLLASRISVRFF